MMNIMDLVDDLQIYVNHTKKCIELTFDTYFKTTNMGAITEPIRVN